MRKRRRERRERLLKWLFFRLGVELADAAEDLEENAEHLFDEAVRKPTQLRLIFSL